MKWRYLIPVIINLLVLFGCAQPNAGLLPTEEKTGQEIELKVVDQTLLYGCQSFWAEGKFSGILAHRNESKVTLIATFNEKNNVDARDFEVFFDEVSCSTIIKCQVYGCVSKSAGRYTADFLRLLRPLGLDFIDDNFEKSRTGLSWEGSVNSVPTSIRVECPPQDSIYEAWGSPYGHCHGHIWWPVSS